MALKFLDLRDTKVKREKIKGRVYLQTVLMLYFEINDPKIFEPKPEDENKVAKDVPNMQTNSLGRQYFTKTPLHIVKPT